jgi:hypothetical protein
MTMRTLVILAAIIGLSATAFAQTASKVRVSRDREHGFQRIVSNDFRGS